MRNLIRRVPQGQEGFTLIELMVVVAIIGLLAAFAVPRLFQAISDAKAAPGKVDLNTVSAGLERYYFANSSYPTTNPGAGLMPTYLKATTTFKNGYGRSFIYGTEATGRGYILIDPKNAADNEAIVITCTGGTGGTVNVDLDAVGLQVISTLVAPNGDLSVCSVTSSYAFVTN